MASERRLYLYSEVGRDYWHGHVVRGDISLADEKDTDQCQESWILIKIWFLIKANLQNFQSFKVIFNLPAEIQLTYQGLKGFKLML